TTIWIPAPVIGGSEIAPRALASIEAVALWIASTIVIASLTILTASATPLSATLIIVLVHAFSPDMQLTIPPKNQSGGRFVFGRNQHAMHAYIQALSNTLRAR